MYWYKKKNIVFFRSGKTRHKIVQKKEEKNLWKFLIKNHLFIIISFPQTERKKNHRKFFFLQNRGKEEFLLFCQGKIPLHAIPHFYFHGKPLCVLLIFFLVKRKIAREMWKNMGKGDDGYPTIKE